MIWQLKIDLLSISLILFTNLLTSPLEWIIDVIFDDNIILISILSLFLVVSNYLYKFRTRRRNKRIVRLFKIEHKKFREIAKIEKLTITQIENILRREGIIFNVTEKDLLLNQANELQHIKKYNETLVHY